MDSTVKAAVAPTRAVGEVKGQLMILGYFGVVILVMSILKMYIFFMSVRGVQLAPLRDDKFQKPISTP